MTKNEKIVLVELIEQLMDKIMREKCVDMEMLTLVDKLARRTFSDIERGWVQWRYYMDTNIFGGDYKKYDEWAKEDCK